MKIKQELVQYIEYFFDLVPSWFFKLQYDYLKTSTLKFADLQGPEASPF